MKGFHTKLLMHKDKAGKMQVQVMKITGTEAYLEKNDYQLVGPSFSGMITIEDYDGRFIEGEWYVDGKFAGTVSEEGAYKGAKVQGYWKTVVTYWFQQVCVGGACGGWDPLSTTSYSVWVADGSGPGAYYGTFYYYNTGGGGGGTGGGGGSNGCPYGPNCHQPVPVDEPVVNEMQVIVPVPDITDELEAYPCLDDVLERLKSKDLRSDVARILHDVFGVNDDINIHFKADPTLPASVDGTTSSTQRTI